MYVSVVAQNYDMFFQLKRSPPKATHRAPLRDERSKVKPKRQLYDEESDGENAINMIRQMFG